MGFWVLNMDLITSFFISSDYWLCTMNYFDLKTQRYWIPQKMFNRKNPFSHYNVACICSLFSVCKDFAQISLLLFIYLGGEKTLYNKFLYFMVHFVHSSFLTWATNRTENMRLMFLNNFIFLFFILCCKTL